MNLAEVVIGEEQGKRRFSKAFRNGDDLALWLLAGGVSVSVTGVQSKAFRNGDLAAVPLAGGAYVSVVRCSLHGGKPFE
jgi:hypothetical protein